VIPHRDPPVAEIVGGLPQIAQQRH
jgi:hypothetical protein